MYQNPNENLHFTMLRTESKKNLQIVFTHSVFIRHLAGLLRGGRLETRFQQKIWWEDKEGAKEKVWIQKF